jgi:replication factor C subunit 2/4
MTQLNQAVIYDETIPDIQKNRIVGVFSEVDKRLGNGAEEHLAILDLTLRISKIMAGR